MTTIAMWYFIMGKVGTVPMQSKEACVAAAREMGSMSLCINTRTGEVINL